MQEIVRRLLALEKRFDNTDAQVEITPGGDLISLDLYDAEPARNSESNMHGGLQALSTGDALNSGSPINVSKGTGKMMIVINAGSDFAGTITVTGMSVDRNTGVSTPGDTDDIIIDALTTDASTTDGNGNTVHDFTGAYITSKWFTGALVISTANVTLTDVDTYHVSFEQFNDSPNIILRSFDVNLYATNNSAEFDAYLYDLHRDGSKCDIELEAELHLGTNGRTALPNEYERLRIGNIDDPLDGTTDGVWVDLHYSNSPAYIEDVTVKVWATKG